MTVSFDSHDTAIGLNACRSDNGNIAIANFGNFINHHVAGKNNRCRFVKAGTGNGYDLALDNLGRKN